MDVGSRPSQLVFILMLSWYHAITIIATTDKCLRLWDCFAQGWPLGSFSRSSSTIVISLIARMPPQGYFSHCHWSVRKVGGNYGYWLLAGGIKATMPSGCDTWMPDKQRINGTVLGVRHLIPAYSRSIEEVQRMWNGFTCSWICKYSTAAIPIGRLLLIIYLFIIKLIFGPLLLFNNNKAISIVVIRWTVHIFKPQSLKK